MRLPVTETLSESDLRLILHQRPLHIHQIHPVVEQNFVNESHSPLQNILLHELHQSIPLIDSFHILPRQSHFGISSHLHQEVPNAKDLNHQQIPNFIPQENLPNGQTRTTILFIPIDWLQL
jgi:hypothetical protein